MLMCICACSIATEDGTGSRTDMELEVGGIDGILRTKNIAVLRAKANQGPPSSTTSINKVHVPQYTGKLATKLYVIL